MPQYSTAFGVAHTILHRTQNSIARITVHTSVEFSTTTVYSIQCTRYSAHHRTIKYNTAHTFQYYNSAHFTVQHSSTMLHCTHFSGHNYTIR